MLLSDCHCLYAFAWWSFKTVTEFSAVFDLDFINLFKFWRNAENEKEIRVSNKYSVSRNGQRINLHSGRGNPKKIVYIERTLAYALGEAKHFIKLGNEVFALIKWQTNLTFKQPIWFYRSSSLGESYWRVVNATDIVGYAVLVPSLADQQKIYVSWRPY